MTQKSLEDLQAYKARLETDIRCSRRLDPDGLAGGAYAIQGQKPVLVRNLEQVKKDIENFTPPVTTQALTESEIKNLNEKEIKVGSHEHMIHALHDHHTSGGAHDANRTYSHPHYDFHFIGSNNEEAKMPAPGAATMSAPVHHYIVIHKQHGVSGMKQAHHYSIRHNTGGNIEVHHQQKVSG